MNLGSDICFCVTLSNLSMPGFPLSANGEYYKSSFHCSYLFAIVFISLGKHQGISNGIMSD